MTGTAADLIELGDSWVAEPIVERPLGSNHTRLGVEYGFDRVAWCAITVALLLLHVFGRWIGRSAAVSRWIEDARNGVEGLELLPADAELEPGDLVAFDFGPASGRRRGDPANFHISSVRNPGTQAKFQTNGGNEGDAMRQQWRDRRYLIAVIRPPYSGPSLPPPLPPIEEDLVNYAYVVREDETKPGEPNGPVLALFGSGSFLHVRSFDDHETIFGLLGSTRKTYGTTRQIPDVNGALRDCWVIGFAQYDGMGLPRA